MNWLSRAQVHDARISARLAIRTDARWLRLLAQVLAHSGDSLLWLAAAGAALFWGAALGRPVGWRIGAATLGAGAATAVLKRAFRRHRPANDTRGLYISADRYAFPSGHAGRTACLALILAPVLPRWGALLLPVWAVAVGLARIGLGIHFLSDIVAGWLTGLVVGLLLLATAWPIR